MELKLWNAYKAKANCSIFPFNLFKDQLYVIIEYAMPIEFYNGNNNLNLLIIVKEFHPDRFEICGVSTYSMTEDQFRECFEFVAYSKVLINEENL